MAGARLERPKKLPAPLAAQLDDFAFRRGEALPLFAALSNSAAALDDLVHGTRASIQKTTLPIRLREILILRTLARWRARAEWDVHVALYASSAALSADEIDWLAGRRSYVVWGPRERVLIDLADSLRDVGSVLGNLWDAIAYLFPAEHCAEVLMVATQYVKVALMNNVLAIPSLVPDGPAIS